MELYLRNILISISRSLATLANTKIITLLMALDGNFHYMGLYRRASGIVPFFMPVTGRYINGFVLVLKIYATPLSKI